MVVPAALRRRSGVLPAARRRGGKRLHRRAARRPSREPLGLYAQHRHRGDRAHRRQWRCGAHHRLRAALPPLRPHLPSAATGAHHRADLRHAAHHHPSAHHAPLRRAGEHTLVEQQQHPLLARRGAGAADHRRAALLRGERGLLRAHATRAHGDGRGRAVRGRAGKHLPRILRPHPRLLDGLGAPPRLLDRLAGRDHPRRHHAQALQFRGDRRASWPRSPPRSRKGRARGATGITAIAGCATPSSWCARSTASARRARWRTSSPTS